MLSFPGTLRGAEPLPGTHGVSAPWLVETRGWKSVLHHGEKLRRTVEQPLCGSCPLPPKEPTSEDTQPPAQWDLDSRGPGPDLHADKEAPPLPPLPPGFQHDLREGKEYPTPTCLK